MNLLVGVALVAVAAAVVLALIARARERQSLMDCCNKLRQVGLALHNYQGTYDGSYPPGTVPNEDLPPERRLSWLHSVYPFVTQEALFRYDSTQPWDAEVNRKRYEWEFVCPSAGHPATEDGRGVTHYVGIAGVGQDAALLPKADRRAGVLGYDRRTTFHDIKDGASTTVLAAETAWENGPWQAGGYSTVRGLDPSRQPYAGTGKQFGGIHRGGFMTLFADGSVHFITDGIHPATFEALATIAGGEEVGTFDAY